MRVGQEVIIDWTISAGNIFQIGSIIIGGLFVLFMLRSDVNSLKVGTMQLRADLGLVQTELKKMGEILVNLADMRGEIRVLNTRVTSSEEDIRELRHGRGFIQNRSQGGIDGEYPR